MNDSGRKLAVFDALNLGCTMKRQLASVRSRTQYPVNITDVVRGPKGVYVKGTTGVLDETFTNTWWCTNGQPSHIS